MTETTEDMTEQTAEQTVEQTPPMSAGKRLRQAREAQGLTLEEVANQLRLHISKLQAIEAEDFSKLPPAAYVSGYLRAYARLLGLPEQELLNSVARVDEPPIVGVLARSQPTQTKASDPPVRAVTFLIFGGLFLLSAFWWVSQPDDPSSPPAFEVEDGVATESIEPDLMPEMVPDLLIAQGEVTQNALLPEGAVAPIESQRTISPAEIPVSPAVKAVAKAPPAEPAVPAAIAKPRAEPVAPAAPPLAAATPQSRLVIRYGSDCWTEVTDAAGRRLVVETIKAGRELVVKGQAPFRVFLGYAPGVQDVTVNGKSFDHNPYKRRNDMAYFRAGNAADNAPLSEGE